MSQQLLPDVIGNTPLLYLRRVSELTGCHIYGKAEFMNPGGSVKDRTALGIVRAAEQAGELRPGGVIVEGTAGNTGIGLTLVANALGYECVIVMPQNASEEKIQQLEMLGYSVDIAENGVEAFEEWRRGDHDLLLTDIHMPIMGGFELIRKIRNSQKFGESKIPIIVITADAMQDQVQKYLDSDLDDYITKPVDMAQFHDTVRNYLQPLDKNEVFSPVYSQLVEQDPEFMDIVDGFLGRLPEVRRDLEAAFSSQDWEECKRRIHELKGLGGAMGYPDLTTDAKHIEDIIKSADFDQLQPQLTKLYQTFERMIAGKDIHEKPQDTKAV